MGGIIFGYLAGVIVLLSVLVVTVKNPVHSVIFMLMMFFHIAGLYLTLNAEFLAAVQIIVYAGAILVLFLFVILLLNLKEEMTVERFVGPWPLGLTAAAALCLMTIFSLRSFVAGPAGSITPEAVRKETNTVLLGKTMFTEYIYPFEVISLILLVAIIGAIVLAKKRLRS